LDADICDKDLILKGNTMKILINITVATAALLSFATDGIAQGFSSGSTGADGALNVTANTTLQVPASGIFNFTTVTIDAGTTLNFTKNALNTPVYLLAQGDVVINGTIDVSGSPPNSPFKGGIGGPGGFDGGPGGAASGDLADPGGDGLGPGGGKHGVLQSTALPASYGTLASGFPVANASPAYGTPALIPIIGGSGGGGANGIPSAGGGGGGGAILISSSAKILLSGSGRIFSLGGGRVGTSFSGGSGGAVRLVAPRIYGTGTIDVRGFSWGYTAGAGRIRVDSIFKAEPTDPSNQNLSIQYQGNNASVGSTMIVFPPNSPRLDLISAAGTTVPEGTPAPVLVQLPFGTTPTQNIIVQARNFAAKVPIRVVLTPASGDSIIIDDEVDNTTANPATKTVSAAFPINQLVRVSAWTR
jgi:hypothetical protein